MKRFASYKRVGWALLLTLLPGLATAQSKAKGPIVTDRKSRVKLALPKDDESFSFIVYGDRTGGPAEGVRVLEQAVADTNELDPDLVMTVGDLIQGYGPRDPWMDQMREFRSIMGELRMPWFPVAGNHDIYWRGEGRPPEEHEGDYELHFGPLWYAFEHKDAWFIVLYSDEPNPETGERNFNKPASQKMSPEQFDWLKKTLRRTSRAKHVFVFLHHPRWIQTRSYGDDWARVHRELAAAGNVSAVFAGHIHRMRFDGVVDGISYYTLATVGGHVSDLPGGGHLHQMHVVTVRDEGIQVAALPVGAVINPEAITGKVSDDVTALNSELQPRFSGTADLQASGFCDGTVEVRLKNPTDRPVAMTLIPETTDRYWAFLPDHAHPTVGPKEELKLTFRLRREPRPIDANFQIPELAIGAEYLADGLRFPIKTRRAYFPVGAQDIQIENDGVDRALHLDGNGDCLRIDSDSIAIPDGPFTVEGRLRARKLNGRRAFVNKTQSSEYGIFVNDGTPQFMVHLGGRYVTAEAKKPILKTAKWHHIAGVYTGTQVRLYVDGSLVASVDAPKDAKRSRNDLPLFIGADPDGSSRPTSFFEGEIDDVRVSPGARYTKKRSPRERVHAPNAWLALSMDTETGPWVIDSSTTRAHATILGNARCDPKD